MDIQEFSKVLKVGVGVGVELTFNIGANTYLFSKLSVPNFINLIFYLQI